MKYILLLLITFPCFAQIEVIKPEFDDQLKLKIIRAYPDELGVYTLVNWNTRKMSLICSGNVFYDKNMQALIEYRNFYNAVVGYFTIENNQICLDMAAFIEKTHMGITEDKPFFITLSKSKMSVTQIVYPKIDPYLDDSDMKELFPKPILTLVSDKKEEGLPRENRGLGEGS